MGLFTPPSCISADSKFFLDLLQSTEIPIHKYEMLRVDERDEYEQVCTRDLKVSNGRGGHAYLDESDSDSWSALLVQT